MTHRLRITLVLLAACLPASALAQAVWRCGPEGRVFSDTPCSDGRLVATVDPRPATEVQAARELARREQRLAERLREERVQRETVSPGAGLAGIGPGPERIKPLAKKAQHLRHRVHKRSADEGTWPAIVPASRQKKG
jgi:hypothetical protein